MSGSESTSQTDSHWIDVAAEDEVGEGDVKLVRAGDRRIALFRLEGGALYAVDNLCPHEGYPLAQGHVKDCVLTCAWHNFKFDLRDGTCLKGDEDVPVFEVRARAGRVELKLATESGQTAAAADYSSLRAGLLDDATARVARDVVRLLDAGVPARRLLLEAALFDAEHAEYGSTHCLPVAADMLRFLPGHPGREAVLPIMQAMDLAAEANVRRTPRVTPAPNETAARPADRFEPLRMLVETEEVEAAEALFRGALASGAERNEVERWLLLLCSDHFLGFGHSLIYVVKAFDLIDAVGWDEGQAILPALLFQIANTTREDVLPPMRFLGDVLKRVQQRLPVFADQKATDWDRETFLRQVLDGSKRDAAGAVTGALESGAAPRVVVDALVLAAAERIVRFDHRIDLDHRVQEGWLDVTHTLTFAAAVRHALERLAEPDLLRLLWQSAHFINRTRPLDLAEARRPDLSPADGAPPAVDEIGAAVAGQEPDRALTLAATYLRSGADIRPLQAEFEKRILQDVAVRPIVVAHVLKTTVVAFEEGRRLRDERSDPRGALPILALIRLLASPLQERRVRRSAHEAIRFLGEGKPPERLTS